MRKEEEEEEEEEEGTDALVASWPNVQGEKISVLTEYNTSPYFYILYNDSGKSCSWNDSDCYGYPDSSTSAPETSKCHKYTCYTLWCSFVTRRRFMQAARS